MRSWRVGSFSMGAALVFLGVFLLLAQLLKWDPAVAMVSWWPILFIILGLEILIYLGSKKDENQRVKYDFISIVFISIIGTFGLGMAVLNQTGLLEVAQQFVSAEERTLDLPKLEELLTDEIQRVVVDTGSYAVDIEASTENKAVMFGTYRGEIGKGQMSIKDVADYALVEQQGDTLYIKMKKLPANRFMHYSGRAEATLLIPSNKELEVVGAGRELYMKPRELKADWSISNAGYVYLNLDEDANIVVEAIDVYELRDEEWRQKKHKESTGDVEESDEEVSAEEIPYKRTVTYGNGAHKIKVQNSHSVQIN